ncbi:Mss4-like protein [Lophiotrema nucula]|uniref:Mss4-like protein n=1 Tax=Lophiotrema nucula TaxID=690887 RepID=A0A6A5YWR4_9PLEO|nr:Mss4-like protein [Lophiotrema nucula]
MPTGHCFCGKVRIEYTDEPKGSALCHCSNCRHYTGSLFSHNLVILSANFIVFGTPQDMTVVADSTNLYRYGDSFGGVDGDRVLQAGYLDDLDEIIKNKPELDVFGTGRVD